MKRVGMIFEASEQSLNQKGQAPSCWSKVIRPPSSSRRRCEPKKPTAQQSSFKAAQTKHISKDVLNGLQPQNRAWIHDPMGIQRGFYSAHGRQLGWVTIAFKIFKRPMLCSALTEPCISCTRSCRSVLIRGRSSS